MSAPKDREHGAQRGKVQDQNFGSAAVRSNLRIPPQSLDTEKALLGALLLNSNAMYEVADIVRLDSFYSGQNRMVFEAMLALYEKGQPLDIISVSTKLKDQKKLNEVGGIAFLSELANAAISPGSAKHYADIIQSKFIFRSLIEAGWNIQELGYDEGRDVAEALDEAERNIFQVSNAPSLKKFISIKEELKGAW